MLNLRKLLSFCFYRSKSTILLLFSLISVKIQNVYFMYIAWLLCGDSLQSAAVNKVSARDRGSCAHIFCFHKVLQFSHEKKCLWRATNHINMIFKYQLLLCLVRNVVFSQWM